MGVTGSTEKDWGKDVRLALSFIRGLPEDYPI